MRLSSVVLIAGLTAASPALAGEKQDFELCDGRIHPARQDDGMRGEPSSPYGIRARGTPPATGIAACDRALASPRLLPTQTVRRAHLLRARAIKHLEARNVAAALGDLEAAARAAPERANDQFYKRSMGVSLDLLRALALVQSGRREEAASLARATMAARPYSLQIQRLGAQILDAAGSGGDASWRSAMQLEPSAAALVLARTADAGDHRRVLELAPHAAIAWPAKTPSAALLLAREGDGAEFVQAMILTLHVGYAKAATGDTTGARQALAEVRTRVTALKAVPVQGNLAAFTAPMIKVVEELVDARRIQIEARAAVSEQRPADAVALLVGASLPKDAASVELLTALKAALPAKDAATVPSLDSVRPDPSASAKDLAKLGSLAIITPETPRALLDYKQGRKNVLAGLLVPGMGQGEGFRSTNNPDGTTNVEYIGNTPSEALVQEMTLLRAAELARAAGKTAFVITERKDYQRSLVTSRAGMEMSRVPQGYKSQLTVRFLDAAGGHPRALDASAVINALGPIYRAT